MGRVIDPLTKMGAVIESNNGKPPLKIKGAQLLKGIDYDLPVMTKVGFAIAVANAHDTVKQYANLITEKCPSSELKRFNSVPSSVKYSPPSVSTPSTSKITS
jgi:5-enolpyruvylshikimate-3-phosphate synthase